jgi:hypothetical protein
MAQPVSYVAARPILAAFIQENAKPLMRVYGRMQFGRRVMMVFNLGEVQPVQANGAAAFFNARGIIIVKRRFRRAAHGTDSQEA